jgi:hypothetical protein
VVHVTGKYLADRAEQRILKSRTTAAFLGPGAVGYWQEEEYQLALMTQQKRNNLVIPVLLPGSSVETLPGFLGLRNAVDFSRGIENELEFGRLVDVVRSRRPSTPSSAPKPVTGAPERPPDPIAQLVESLALNNITFFLGSETAAASAAPSTRDCDIAYKLLSEIKLIAERSEMLLPADAAALYYAVSELDAGLEKTVVGLVQGRQSPSPSLHERLARLLPRLMGFQRLRGRKPHRQLIVSTSLDTLMERALVERVRFVRIARAGNSARSMSTTIGVPSLSRMASSRCLTASPIRWRARRGRTTLFNPTKADTFLATSSWSSSPATIC